MHMMQRDAPSIEDSNRLIPVFLFSKCLNVSTVRPINKVFRIFPADFLFLAVWSMAAFHVGN